MPVILATQEAEIRRIAVRNQPGQIFHEILSRKKKSQKRTGGVAQGVCPEFKSQYCKKKKKERKEEHWRKNCALLPVCYDASCSTISSLP
jgi:hypothetical protein